ncbi:MAG TPA: hypothetical protein VNT56_03670 [Acidimicrobiales bacterium]|nr:hypothetical protein [Acidimicrobiales bacterium]
MAVPALRDRLQRAMTQGAGVVRTEASLAGAASGVRELAAAGGGDREGLELANLVTVARAVVQAAAARTESRGCHWRADHPGPDPALGRRLVLCP